MNSPPARMAMIGGGPGSFIGPVHRCAAMLDGEIELVAGAFSSDVERSAEAGRKFGIDPARAYGSVEDLIAAERLLPADRRAEFFAIVTPNHLHADQAMLAASAGFPVLCEKPLAGSVAEAHRVATAAEAIRFGLTYTYIGYPLIQEARALIADGRIGAVRRIEVRYTQGWLATHVEHEGNAQAAWRTDPAQAGISGAFLDIGVHAQHLAEYVAGDRIARVAADIRAAVPGRRLDDDGALLFRTIHDIPGTVIVSQIAAGDRNRLELRIYGERGSLAWAQERPDELKLAIIGDHEYCITTDAAQLLSPVARKLLRLPAGHPEGYIEAFANLYRAFSQAVRADAEGRVPAHDAICVPNLHDGVHSLAFVDAVVASSANGSAWTEVAG